MDQSLVLVRGLPGSGKTTLANHISQLEGRVHVEADMYFTNEYGEYKFISDEIEKAHNWCINQVRRSLRKGDIVVVSNTFCRPWEMTKYLELEPTAKIIECTGCFESIHGVPDNIIENMEGRFATQNEVLERFPNISYEVKEPEFFD